MKTYRDYSDKESTVAKTYKLNHSLQTIEYAKTQIELHCTKFNKDKMTIWDAIEKLDRVIDESDPDLDLPQIIHAFQTAEELRSRYPDIDWLPLVGLIHDLGKIIALPEYGSQPQWSTVGDTFPLGCAFSNKIIFHDYFKLNPNYYHEVYNRHYGIYSPNCGLDNVIFSFGHDEYLYQVLKFNNCLIPDEGLKIIRYHSFYAWHKEGAYEHLMSDYDYKIRDLCKQFSECDLYTKDNNKLPDVNQLKPYYQQLINKYFPNPIIQF